MENLPPVTLGGPGLGWGKVQGLAIRHSNGFEIQGFDRYIFYWGNVERCSHVLFVRAADGRPHPYDTEAGCRHYEMRVTQRKARKKDLARITRRGCPDWLTTGTQKIGRSGRDIIAIGRRDTNAHRTDLCRERHNG